MRPKHPRLKPTAVDALRKKQAEGNGWTKLAAHLDISEDLLQKMLTGARGVSSDVAARLSQMLNMSIEEICLPN